MPFFQDPEFPSYVAMKGSNYEDRFSPLSPSSRYEWIPASCLSLQKLSTKDPSRTPLFRDLPGLRHGSSMVADLQQGDLGDCWLIAALACLAKYPKKIKSLFETTTEDGKYVIRLYDSKGDLRRVTIDEFVPVKLRGKKHVPLFCLFEGELWPLLLEKAMAKLLGSYGALHRGTVTFAFRALTGCDRPDSYIQYEPNEPWEKLFLKDGDFLPHDMNGFVPSGKSMIPCELGEYLLNGIRQQCMLCALIMGSFEDRKDGLSVGHAYSLLDVRRVPHYDEDTRLTSDAFLMIRLRNPHGRRRWNGDWSDESPLWRRFPSVAKALDFKAAQESLIACGHFWMEFQDFVRIFNVVEVCNLSMDGGTFASRVMRSATPVRTQMPRERDERRRSATPGRSPGPCKMHKDHFTTRQQDERRSSEGIATPPVLSPPSSVFNATMDTLRGRTPPPGFRSRTPPPAATPRRTPQ